MLSRKAAGALATGLVVALTAVGVAGAAKPTETWTVIEHDVTLPPQFYPAEPNGLCGPYPATWETFTNKTQMNHLTARPDGSFVFKDFETGFVEVDYVDPDDSRRDVPAHGDLHGHHDSGRHPRRLEHVPPGTGAKRVQVHDPVHLPPDRRRRRAEDRARVPLRAGLLIARQDTESSLGCATIRRSCGPRLLIVDDHADFRASARSLLELEGFDVVGVAADGEEALAVVARLEPDVVLLDVQLPGMDGFEVARALADRDGAPRVVLVSSRDRSAYASQLSDPRVSGFLGKCELSGAALHALVA